MSLTFCTSCAQKLIVYWQIKLSPGLIFFHVVVWPNISGCQVRIKATFVKFRASFAAIKGYDIQHSSERSGETTKFISHFPLFCDLFRIQLTTLSFFRQKNYLNFSVFNTFASFCSVFEISKFSKVFAFYYECFKKTPFFQYFQNQYCSQFSHLQ